MDREIQGIEAFLMVLALTSPIIVLAVALCVAFSHVTRDR